MTQPAVGTVATRLYEQLEPLAYADEENNWALLIFLGAIGQMMQDLHDLVSDGEQPGWSSLLDVERCPAKYLDYLGWFVGVRIPVGTPEAQARQLVREKAGFARGTRESMIAATKRHLTGSKAVSIIERDGSPYLLTVRTRTSETPDPALTLADILSQKPGGIMLQHIVSDFTIIDELVDTIDDQTGDIDDL